MIGYIDKWESLWEFYNKCHNPSGPDGGQFCESAIDSGNLSSSEKKAVQGAYQAIREVHELPKGLAKAYVEMADSDTLGQHVDGTYNSGEDRILLNADKQNNAITFVHEFGHHISLSGEGNFSANQFQDRIDRSNPLRAWRDAVQASDTVQGLKEKRVDPYFEYLLDDRELFARAYTQWIVLNSNNRTLKRQFEELDVNMKWGAKEFEPIARTLDRIFTYERMSRGDFAGETETFHLQGQHDQSSHGSWAPDAGEFEALRQKLKNTKEGQIDISAFSDFDIPRHQMPQLKAKPEPGSKADSLKKNKSGEVNLAEQFVESLTKEGIRSIRAQIAPEKLKPTQGEVDAAKVQDARWDEPDIHFNPRSYVLVSKDNYIIDGHHRWAGALVRNPDARIPILKVDLTAEELLPYTRAFTDEWGIQKKSLLAHGSHDQKSHGNWATGSIVEPAVKANYIDQPDKVMSLVPSSNITNPDEYLSAVKAAKSQGGSAKHDQLLKEIREVQGFSVKPQVVSQEDFDKIDGPTLYRGVTKSAYNDAYRSGEHFASTGIFGNGDYFTNNVATAFTYVEDPDKGGVIAAKIRPDARVITIKDALALYRKAQLEILKPMRESSDPEVQRMLPKYERMYYEPGVVAASYGYDVIYTEKATQGGEDYYTILNRGALVVSDKDIKEEA